MFDHVTCEVDLPDGWKPEPNVMQTKDLDCALTTLKITVGGRLLVQDFEYEEVPREERPYPEAEGLLGLAGSLRRVNERWRDLEYHGDLNFYGSEGRYGEPGYVDHAYVARFTDGRLVRITKIEEE